MDYLFHSMIALAVLAISLSLVRSRGRAKSTEHQMKLAAKNRKRRQRQAAKAATSGNQLPNQKAVIKREVKQVPTPWGWAGSDVRHGDRRSSGLDGSYDSLKHWVERLMAEKRTVQDEEYCQRKNAALRSMLEDRFGHAAKPTEMEYRRVKPPRLRDPNRPHDQMDNFPSGQTSAIVGKLSRQPGKPKLVKSGRPVRKVAGLENIKKPWGW